MFRKNKKIFKKDDSRSDRLLYLSIYLFYVKIAFDELLEIFLQRFGIGSIEILIDHERCRSLTSVIISVNKADGDDSFYSVSFSFLTSLPLNSSGRNSPRMRLVILSQ